MRIDGGIRCLLAATVARSEEPTVAPLGLPRIEAGTLVEDSDASRWNRVVLLAKPRIASGDVDAVPKSARTAAANFVLTILATVTAEDAGNASSVYRLDELGVGYCMNIDGQLKIVTSDKARSMGLYLGFIQSNMLSENEKQLDTVRVITRTTTLVIFDTPAILLRQAQHQDFLMRHFVWVDSRTGRNAALVWLLKQDATGTWKVADEPMRWLPPGMKEDRAIHVDGDEFSFFGIPNDRAFALEDLPPGKPIEWTAEARRLAAMGSYPDDVLRELTTALNAALQSSR